MIYPAIGVATECRSHQREIEHLVHGDQGCLLSDLLRGLQVVEVDEWDQRVIGPEDASIAELGCPHNEVHAVDERIRDFRESGRDFSECRRLP